MSTITRQLNKQTPFEFDIAVAMGDVPGFELFRKFGANDDVPATGSVEMWGYGVASRILPTVGGEISLVSANAADDTGGTGALSITLEVLDANYVEDTIVIIPNGTAPVVTTGGNTFFRINKMYATAAGAAEVNVGDITASIGGDVQAIIEAGHGQTTQTHFTVPADKLIIVAGFSMGVGRMAGSSDLSIMSMIKVDGETSWRAISHLFLYEAQISGGHAVTVLPAKTELKQIIESTSTTQAHSTWHGYLVDTDHKIREVV